MPNLFYLLLAYGICFGIQNKLPFLYSEGYLEDQEPQRLLDRLLHCTYCTGFHCGWLTWLLVWGLTGQTPVSGIAIPFSVVAWAFISGIFCYFADALVKLIETRT